MAENEETSMVVMDEKTGRKDKADRHRSVDDNRTESSVGGRRTKRRVERGLGFGIFGGFTKC
jgi:hypothetical protein